VSHPMDSPLSFGQRYHWWNHHLLAPGTRHELSIVLRYTPPPGASVESLRLALQHLADRYEVLRTTFHSEGPVQRVHPVAPVPLICIENDDGEPGGATALGSARRDFDLARELPIRALIFTKGTKPAIMIIILHHIAVDDWGANLLISELERVHEGILAGRPVSSGKAGPQPSDLARLEAADMAMPGGASRSALAYWERELAAAPADPFASRRRIPAPSEPAALGASLSSPACAAAARELAIRYRVWPSNVYLAAFIVMLHCYTGQQVMTCRLYCANRDRGERNAAVASLSLPVPMRVDCAAAATFADVVRQTAESSGTALAHSYFPYDEALELTALRGCRAQRPVSPGAIFNFLNHSATVSGLKRTVFLRNSPPVHWAQLGEDAHFRLYQRRDCAVATLNALTSIMSDADMEAFLRGFEAILIAQAAASLELRLDEPPLTGGFGPVAPPDYNAPATLGQEGGAGARDSVPRTAAEAALDEAFRQANGQRPATLDRCYVDAGGKLIHAPRVLEFLGDDGWSGLRLQALAGPVPLVSATRTMTRQ
jgi:hypothetical protein